MISCTRPFGVRKWGSYSFTWVCPGFGPQSGNGQRSGSLQLQAQPRRAANMYLKNDPPTEEGGEEPYQGCELTWLAL